MSLSELEVLSSRHAEVREFEKGRLEVVTIGGHERYVSLHFLGAGEYAS